MSVDGHVLNSAGLATIGLGMLDSPGSTACADLPPYQAAAGSRARNRIAALMMRQAQIHPTRPCTLGLGIQRTVECAACLHSIRC